MLDNQCYDQLLPVAGGEAAAAKPLGGEVWGGGSFPRVSGGARANDANQNEHLKQGPSFKKCGAPR